MKLIDNWRCGWRFLSVQIAAVAAAGQATLLAFPSIRDWLSDTTVHVVGVVLLLSIIAARAIDQTKPAP